MRLLTEVVAATALIEICHEVRMHGPTVPPELEAQFFYADTAPAQALLTLFRAATP
ncbi:hypothetical protein [Streptomyces fagopyri]|uniref:hypothetical protein n=1 Tax=Streptomyces fagopyri TaxID=2662397 RepID=UPI0033C49AA0